MNYRIALLISIILIFTTTASADSASASRAAKRALKKSEACVVDSNKDTMTAKNKDNGDLVFLRKCSKRGLNKANLEDLKQDVLSSVETLVTGGEDGTDGLQGPAGPQGPQGPAGPSGMTGAYWFQFTPAAVPGPAALQAFATATCPGANEIAMGAIGFHALGAFASISEIIPVMGLVNGANVPIGYTVSIVPSGAVVAPAALPLATGVSVGFWCIPQ